MRAAAKDDLQKSRFEEPTDLHERLSSGACSKIKLRKGMIDQKYRCKEDSPPMTA